MFYLFFALGLLTRVVFIPLAGFKADVAFWKGWGLAAADKGVLWMMTSTNYNYPPGFSYILWLINKIYAFFKDPYNINDYWVDDNVFYLFLLKLITIAADLLVVFLIIKFSQKVQQQKLGKILALFYFLNPAVIYDGVIWGQVDQLGFALFFLSAYLLLKEKPYLASVVFTISFLMKFQNIIFIPLFYLFIWKKFSYKELVSSLTISFITFVIVILPFFLNKQADRLIWLLTINSDWFPWYSLNAFNGWWIASGLNGMGLTDKHLIFGITSAKQFGLFMFIFAYFIAVVTIVTSKKEELFKNFILACTLAVFVFFHLLTQSHERYLFPAMGLLLVLGSYMTYKTNKTNWRAYMPFSIFYLLVSIFFFLNMYLSMGWNYPDQVIPTFTREQTLGLSWWISLIQMILFIIFFFWFLKDILVKKIFVIGGFGLLVLLALLVKNESYFLGKQVSLTSLKPISYRQDYLQPVYGKTVESDRGTNYWNRLSVNYYFYEGGIGSHADSDITYHLAKKFSKFSTDFGIDTEGEQSAKVYFSIWADGKELFKSEVKGRFDIPGTKTVDVREVNYLTLKINKDTATNFGAHADWLNPVLVK